MRERTGVLATIFVDSVELIASLSEIDATLLLGRAIAHELGHLLLGTNAHSVRGLMRAGGHRRTSGSMRSRIGR